MAAANQRLLRLFSSEHVGAHTLPKFATFKYLGLVFHESGSMSDALARLAHNGKGAMARLTAKFAGLMCTRSFSYVAASV